MECKSQQVVIKKSAEKSFFVGFHKTSALENHLLRASPKYYEKEVCILQIMIAHDGFIIAELVYVN